MRKQALRELIEITEKQQVYLKEEDWIMFSDLMSKKEILIEQLKKHCNIEMDEEEKQLLKEAVRIDQLNQKEFIKEYQEVKEKIRTIRMSKAIHNVYSNPHEAWQEEGIFFDKK